MSRLSTALSNDYKALCLLRDELALHTSLLKAELKDRWNKLEADFATLREHIGRAEVAAEDSRKEVEAAASKLLNALRTSYTDMRNALKS
ncbi:MAG: hypothetical protein P4L83_15030 [Nevskia sp.]|nr:hypothetical protein [Nevskia sp.]